MPADASSVADPSARQPRTAPARGCPTARLRSSGNRQAATAASKSRCATCLRVCARRLGAWFAQMRSTFTFQCNHCGKPKKQAASKCPCRRELKLKEQQKDAEQKQQSKEKAQPAPAASTPILKTMASSISP